jgi:hypothetical protein
MILLEIEAEAMARLSGRGKKRRKGRAKRKNRWSAGEAEPRAGPGNGLEQRIERPEWSIRGPDGRKTPLGAQLWVGSPSLEDSENEGKILLRHFAKWSGNLGRGAHTKTVVDRPPGAEPLLWANIITKNRHNSSPVDTRSMDPATLCVEAITILFSASLGALELWDLTDKRSSGLGWLWPKIFSPSLMSQAMRLPVHQPGTPGSPHAAPTWRRNGRFQVVNAAARVPPGIHCCIRGRGMTTG